jgi:sugar lactone lactonase YvrE
LTPRLKALSDPEPLAGTLEHPHGLVEAPRDDDAGALLYTDILQGGVYRVRGDAAPQTVVPKRRGVGGQLLHADGGLVISGRTVIHTRDAEDRELLSIEGVHGFNDMISDDAGAVYVGALRFKPFLGEKPRPTEVWRIDGDCDASVAADGIDWPNGIGFSPDGARMYVSDTAHGVVRVFEAGSTEGAEFARIAPGAVDGLAVDEDGGVWVALGDAGIARFDAQGELDGIASVPSNFVSSLCFGGPDCRNVFITTCDNLERPERGGAVFRARSEIAGRPVAPAAV